ncbi:MAG: glycine/betaine/sarcosine/D-proline family reductase selenoprotein B [Pseudomonadales bacterium]|nr:glycine/betaine/sarcosine/D-proline family reductase selenoprotein B [Pseudomonadales bacterium]
MGNVPSRTADYAWGDPPNPGECDPYLFLEEAIHKLIRNNVKYGTLVSDIPWSNVKKPVNESSISVVSTAGLSMADDEPFDMETERKRPTWGDPSWRRLDRDVNEDSVAANHLHIETSYLLDDLDVCFPVPLLRQLQRENVIGNVAPSHYSIMGFQGSDLRRIAPSCVAIAEAMVNDDVDLALLVPV